MPRIVSGTGQSVNTALLEGLEIGRGFARARDERAMRQAQLQELQMKFQEERTKALADANLRAQRGELAAMQQQDMMRQIEGLPPDKKMLLEFAQLDSRLEDPKLKAELRQTFGELQGELKLHEGYKAAAGEIERAAKDGLIDEAGIQTFQARLQAKQAKGESTDDILTEFSQARMQRAEAAANVQENTEALEKAKQLVASMPPGRERKLASVALAEYTMSPSLQEKDGSGAKLLATVSKIGVGPMSRYDEIEQAKQEKFNAQAAPGLGGMTVGERNAQLEKEPGFLGFGGPKIPPLDQSVGTHATVKQGTKKPKDAAKIDEVAKGAKSLQDLVKKLKEAGVPATPEGLAYARSLFQGGAGK